MPRPRPPEPVQAAVDSWLTTLDAPQAWKSQLLSSAPKRYAIYEPMVLFPSGSFTSAEWAAELSRQPPASTTALWTAILDHLSRSSNAKKKQPLTHLAVNQGIPLSSQDGAGENVRRSPSGLRILHGDFGHDQPPDVTPDFDAALWVSTKQNGIFQTWAPRWTMFSRGNVKEKARLLDSPRAVGDVCAVDLYAGIGYFTFCYAALGMTVFCWEINPWSVEALRRGAHANGWTVQVIQGAALVLPVEQAVTPGARIYVFLEDNARAADRIGNLQRHAGMARHVAHVNCGFLPTSMPTWDAALGVTRKNTADGNTSWLHLHENVGEHDIQTRKEEVQASLRATAGEERPKRNITVTHVEKVKTYAPGVWHCVFDVSISGNTPNS